MTTKSEQALFPPESAKAIYLAMESLSSSVQNQVERLSDKMEIIEQGIDSIREGMADGRVRFEKHEGDIGIVTTRVDNVERRVDDMESGVREASRLPAKSNEALHPKNADGTDRVEKDLRVKAVNALVIAIAAAVGSGLGALIWSKLQTPPPAVTVNATSNTTNPPAAP